MELRSAEFGSLKIQNLNSNIVKNLDDETVVLTANWPITESFRITIRGLAPEMRNQLIDFYQGSAGQEIIITDDDLIVWTGFIVDTPEISDEGHNTCKYLTSFTFEGRRS